MSLFARFARRLQNNDSALHQGATRDIRETAATAESIAQIFDADAARQAFESGLPPRNESGTGGRRRHNWVGA
jgi:hypothetical protein